MEAAKPKSRQGLTFVKVIEVWRPMADGQCLEWGGGLYGDYPGFRKASRQQRFAFGEGLPGKAWALRRPLVLSEFVGSYFKRVARAKQAGLNAAVAVPVFAGDFLLAVVVFFCGTRQGETGGIEIWSRKRNQPNQLALMDGYYGSLEQFEWLSRQVNIATGAGLPGRAWETGLPQVVEDLADSYSFVRARAAADAGLSAGVSLPFADGGVEPYVLTLLSAEHSPLARRMEIWHYSPERQALVFAEGHCIQGQDLAALYEGVEIRRGEGLLGALLSTGLPQVGEDLASGASEFERAALAAGLGSAAVLPVIHEGRLRAAVACLL